MGVKFIQGDALALATFEAVAEAGFDYVELPLSAIWNLLPSEVEKLRQALQAIPCKACNIFFPGGLDIVGPEQNINGLKTYLEKMLPLAASLGAKTLVFGSGGARKIPEGQTREATWRQLRGVLDYMNGYAETAGVKISVEPLNLTETDMLNTYGDAVAISKGLPNIATMIDSYHVATDGQTYDDVYENPDKLWHLHTAYPTGRMVPSPGDDMALYADFVKMVKTLGYDDKISVEGALRATEPQGIKAEVKACLGVLKGMFE